MKLFRFTFFLLVLAAVARAQSTIVTDVIYVNTGIDTKDSNSIAALRETVGGLNTGGQNVDGITYRYNLRIVDTVSQAVSWAQNPPPGTLRVMFVGHGLRNAETGEYYRTVDDTTSDSTPFSEISDYFWLFWACGLDGKSLDNDQFGQEAAARNGHKYKQGRVQTEGGSPQGVSNYWSPSGSGSWYSFTITVQFTIFHSGGADTYLTSVSYNVWVPDFSGGGGNQNLAYSPVGLEWELSAVGRRNLRVIV
jgi:hypothetical protein